MIECDDEGARGRARGGAHRVDPRLEQRRAARLRRAVPRQSPGQAVRAGAAQGRHPVQGLGRAELLRPGRDPRPLRLAAPLVNSDDDPAFLRAATSPKRGIGHQTLAGLGTFAGRWKTSLFEALFAETLGHGAAEAQHRDAARVRPHRERARAPGPRDRRRGGGAGLPARLAEGHRLRAAPARRGGFAAAGDGALEQRARLRRLDRPPLRRHRRGGDRRRGRGEERARGGAVDLGDRQPRRARRRPERRHAVDAARRQGPRVAARRARRRQRGPAAVSRRRGRGGAGGGRADRGGAAPDVRRHHPRPRRPSSSARWPGASAAARPSPACRAASSPR